MIKKLKKSYFKNSPPLSNVLGVKQNSPGLFDPEFSHRWALDPLFSHPWCTNSLQLATHLTRIHRSIQENVMSPVPVWDTIFSIGDTRKQTVLQVSTLCALIIVIVTILIPDQNKVLRKNSEDILNFSSRLNYDRLNKYDQLQAKTQLFYS